jgi:predicted ArsR family transcriptional regulator
MTKGNLSSHLAKLEESGYVEIEKTYRGKVPLTMCRLSKDGQSAFRQYLENLKRAMDSMPKLRSRDPKKQSRRFASSRFGARQALDGRLAPQ